MRDPARIKKFCDELANIWEQSCPDQRFGQFITNVFNSQQIYDPWFLEDDEMLERIQECGKEWL